MAINKLNDFYFKKLGSWNLIHSFIKGFWRAFFLIVLLIIVINIIVANFLDNAFLMPVMLISLLYIPLLYYLLIYNRAKKFIRTRYQLRNFKELTAMRRYLLYAYLEKSGFSTRDDLDKLLRFVHSEMAEEKKNHKPLNTIIGVFIAAFLAILGGSFLFLMENVVERLIAAVIIIVLAVFLYFIGLAIMRIIRSKSEINTRKEHELTREIIAIQTAMLVSENTSYHPFLAMEKKVNESEFLKEIITSRSFL
ncbi:hypothetical protein QJV03_02545 [Listeria swaminathanii]|uniref:ABC transporter ATP-binding protein n=1 Tax=Listeria swaminathanii TaxID=2713501 RepID=A0ABU2IE55_9LIST|nr:hypothetical protein [Listeria swaminathanii]MDT0016063.1 hypothetical protein [Listeria swaminathanii]MDT0021499.1 hypothetical protein [Listeria swaminathanii]MDT0032463.1 hypothetical protein [Listeria swaminathanii]MDT0051687.1 hypothetical protein [Listeria swaminathanii]MDT0054452.1 hypothetical protein [Listeria swaminathanii]